MKTLACISSILAAAIMVLITPGCFRSQDPADSPVYEKGGSIEIVDVTRDETKKIFRARVLRNDESRNIAITRADGAPFPGAMSAETRDDEGNLLYRIEMAMIPGEDALWFLEQTETDVLTAYIRRTRDRVYERYDINGETLEIDYPRLEDAAMDKIVARYLKGEELNSTPEVEEVAARLAEFDAFYSPHIGNSLHDNPDGELLVTLLSDPSFAGLVTGEELDPQLIKDRTKRACWAALTCTGFKCKLGGLANPLCDACAGVAVACIIAEIACWFLGCDCCF